MGKERCPTCDPPCPTCLLEKDEDGDEVEEPTPLLSEITRTIQVMRPPEPNRCDLCGKPIAPDDQGQSIADAVVCERCVLLNSVTLKTLIVKDADTLKTLSVKDADALLDDKDGAEMREKMAEMRKLYDRRKAPETGG